MLALSKWPFPLLLEIELTQKEVAHRATAKCSKGHVSGGFKPLGPYANAASPVAVYMPINIPWKTTRFLLQYRLCARVVFVRSDKDIEFLNRPVGMRPIIQAVDASRYKGAVLLKEFELGLGEV
ncbi:hypothetical protein [uncultured Erythrobacter sp.]|uniref:hypothetical protein n=1 Tax=uncultured Erythrobacter sp. TaxID=263913 RepID=UPI00261C12B1|nr:hypothetical protein [uncultured Erythrobacter sp.]